jgi:pyruvate/2-oxoglutarate dehydrogenase complex dihydrolipoamide acyltransferase (E2) component
MYWDILKQQNNKMIIEIKIPVIEEGVEEYFVAFWHKENGSVIKKNEDLVEIETDMDAYTIPADEDGILEIVAEEGTYLKADDVLYNIIVNDK